MALLTAKEAKDRLRISLSLIYLLVEQKEIRAIRIGGKGRRGAIRIEASEIERYLEARRQAVES